MNNIYDINKRKQLINVAAGNVKSSLVIKNVNYLNVFTKEFEVADIAIEQGRFAGIGQYEGRQEIDGKGKYIVPGFIDGHMHLESSSVTPLEYAKTVVKHGTTAVIADPHEIVNVCGIDGFEYIYKATDFDIMDVYLMIPSCVPATMFDENGAKLKLKQIKTLFEKYNDRCLGLAEVMNYSGVISGDDEVLEKIEYIYNNGGKIDGHAPQLSGKLLNAYNVAGIYTDHECSTFDEAVEKLRNGEWIMVREGTAAKNLKQLIGMFNDKYSNRVLLVTDDRHLEDLINDGHIDYIIRKAIKYGAKPENLYVCASFNAAQCFGLKETGAICPGYKADFVILDDKYNVGIDSVYKNGIKVYDKNDKSIQYTLEHNIDKKITNTVHINDVTADDFIYEKLAKIIGVIKGELITTDEGKLADITKIENDKINFFIFYKQCCKTYPIYVIINKNFLIRQAHIPSDVWSVAYREINIIGLIVEYVCNNLSYNI